MTTPEALRQTPLTAFNIAQGGKMVPFAGYEMPVQFPDGVMKEHLHCRAAVGLFDVSHMGQVIVRPKSGRIEDAMLALEQLVPIDILGLKAGRQRYGLFTAADGGILDDLMIANCGDHLFIVVNATCKAADIAHMRSHMSDSCEIEGLTDRALIALQGPEAEAALSALAPEASGMRFMDVTETTLLGSPAMVARAGYTGEDGYEISISADRAVALAEALLADARVRLVGLGARDSLRLESGLCLYGHDIDPSTTPGQGSLEWAIQKVRRNGGARAGGFPGADVVLPELEKGASQRRVGLLPEGRAPVREGTALFATESSEEPMGRVTSGGFGPTVNAPVAMGYVPAELFDAGTILFAEVRGKRLAVSVASLPFIAQRYKRS
ncbi:MAG TPA: glycine cleavage system aminomethyltransferase GcvT [Mesorhizobium sp.]|jgi:aminomethyltransferase|uniref:glycine cleavage system aminomethyltransferase GcvT n=1 Tax=Mesorhizobium sp. TaxID=1871066 RepID=UPI002DDD083B|nr:glycine cleavage system aminomethyltransferase GcvT [Mesorhizobium sp.]HEV2501801.1 glycine cleavage system aminomethyltransferase GcvT [Mesorhizobium sp.]